MASHPRDRPAFSFAVAEHVFAARIKIDPLKVAKIDRVRAGRPGPAEEIGIGHLQPETAPSARGMAVEQAGTRIGDGGERSLDMRDELLDQRRAPRAVGRAVGEDVVAGTAVGVEHDTDEILPKANRGSSAKRESHVMVAAEPRDDVDRRQLVRLVAL